MDARLQQFSQCADGGRPALIYLDLDHFKLINDTCGHQRGDRLLAELSHRLKMALPEDLILARLGGYEFTVIVLDTDLRDPQSLAERLRRAVLAGLPVQPG
ncbi:MAG: GGDEF domain-containing protein [Nitrococcus mobilis]|nr:GGDEF domain-containing protein [Nitrococcus mobilis]